MNNREPEFSKKASQKSSEKKSKTLPALQKPKNIVVLKLLTKQRDDDEAKTFKLDKERIVLGSVISADVRLTGEAVSPIHAVLEFNSEKSTAVLFDLASDSGLFVNDQKVVTHTLKVGDRITIGRYELKFSVQVLNPNSNQERTHEIEGRTLFLNPDEDFTPLLLESEREVIEIFDFRPTSKRALEVVMSWCGVILAVEHFVHEKSVTIGNTLKSDFAIPPLLSSSQYPIVVQSGGGFVLNLDTQMKGVMQKAGELKNLDEVRESTMKGPHGYEVPIGDKDFCKISIEDIDFYFSFTAAPPRLKRRRLLERDPVFNRIFFASMAFSAVIFYLLIGMRVSTIEPEVPERIATILYQPERFMKPPKPVPKPTPTPTPTVKPEVKPVEPPQPKPTPTVTVKPKPVEPTNKPIPKEMNYTAEPKKPAPQPTKLATKPVTTTPKPVERNAPSPKAAAAKEGEGARAKGAEGSRGEKNKPKSQAKVTQISRPSPNAGTKGAAGRSQVQDEGNVDLLKGASGKIQNILGNSAANLGEGSQDLKGFGNFSTGGSGGLALSGSGQGGGGSADTTLGGLGKKGNGMGRVGTGKGAAGNGTGIVGSHTRVSIQLAGPEESVVMGAIDPNAIDNAINAHKDEFRLCYEREINAETPNIVGQVAANFSIGSSGRVTEAGIDSSSIGNANIERCVIKVLKRIQFPIPQGGGVVQVTKSFKFHSNPK